MNRVLAHVLLVPPPGISSGRYHASLIGPLALGLSCGVQSILALVMIFGPLATWPAWDELTAMGKSALHPEYDFPAYAAGCALTLLLALGSALLWNRHLHRVPASGLPEFLRFGSALQTGAAVVSFACFLVCTEALRRSVFDRWRFTGLEIAIVLAPGLLALAIVWIHYRTSNRGFDQALLPRIMGFLEERKIARDRVQDVAACFLVFAIVYVPYMSNLAGRIYLRDEFFHWDSFIMGPALSFLNGKAFGIDIYSTYGVGYPLLAAGLSPILPLSYTNAVSMMVLYACFYYVGLYFLLRAVVRDATLSLAGILSILWMTLYSHQDALQPTMWVWPSSTVLRTPMDVWFFLALWRHASTGKGRWVLAAGVAAGLAILFEIDTGFSLAVVLGVYAFAQPLLVGETKQGATLRAAAIGALGSAAVLFTGLLAASRGAIVSDPAAFFHGWLEGFTGYPGSGVGGQILLARINIVELAFFAGVLGLCFIPVAKASIDLLHNRFRPLGLLLACGGLYGLARVTLFVWRSVPLNLYHTAVPALVILLILLAEWRRRTPSHPDACLAERTRATRWISYGCLTGAALLLWFSPAFHAYPGVLRTLAKGKPAVGLTLFDGGAAFDGLPHSRNEFVARVEAGIEGVRALREGGRRVVILDERSTLYNLATDNPPWGRNPLIFFDTFTTARREAIREELFAEKPDYVLIRGESPSEYYTDTWTYFRDSLADHYTKTNEAGFFEVWERNGP